MPLIIVKNILDKTRLHCIIQFTNEFPSYFLSQTSPYMIYEVLQVRRMAWLMFA